MKYKLLKKTNIEISTVGFGTNAVGGHNLFKDLDEERGKRTILTALNEGITLFDTADAYGFGRSEELLGEVLLGNRNKAVIATKGGIEKLADGTVRFNNRPSYLREALEKSLKRLKTDYIDIYYIHFPDQLTPLDEAVGGLSQLKKEGKIRAIGISNVTIDQLKIANKDKEISVLQSPYNMLSRTAEAELLPYCIENDIAFVPYGPLAFGILGGKYDENFKLNANDWRNEVDLFREGNFHKNLQNVKKLKYLAAEKETNIANLALAWLLHQDGIDTVIPGGKKPEQVVENAKAAEIQLTAGELQAIKGIIEFKSK